VHLDDGSGFDLTEAGTRKGLAVYVVKTLADVDGIGNLGPDALAADLETFTALLAATTSRLKTVLTDQRTIAGIGNAYSDEILHVARLSPYKRQGMRSGGVGAGPPARGCRAPTAATLSDQCISPSRASNTARRVRRTANRCPTGAWTGC